MIEDAEVFPKILKLADCLCQELAASALPEPCWCGVVVGDLFPSEFCSDCTTNKCGSAWVRLAGVFPSNVLPTADQSTGSCTAPLAFTVEVGVDRCAAVGDSRGNPPTVGQRLEEARLVLADMQAMRRAIVCCFGTKDYVLGEYTPRGPQGGCVGGTWTVTASVF